MSKRTENEFDFSNTLSNTKNKSVENQVSRLIESSSILHIGEHRHERKAEASEMGLKGSHSVNSYVGITSYSSKHTESSRILNFCKYVVQNCGVKGISQISTDHIKSFCCELVEREYSSKTAANYLGAIERLAVMLDEKFPLQGHLRTEEWHDVCKDQSVIVRSECPHKDIDSRAFHSPNDVLSALPQNTQFELIGSLQLNHGLRVADACDIRHIDENGVLISNSKGGKPMTTVLSPHERELYDKFKDSDGKLIVSQRTYYEKLKTAASSCGEDFNGTHQFRHNFAQQRMIDLTKSGHSYGDSLAAVSKEMGHDRIEITLSYLR